MNSLPSRGGEIDDGHATGSRCRQIDGLAHSPIRHIPPEILSQIFILCLPENCLPRPHRLEAPLLLCQICSLFMKVAHATPALWAGISVERHVPRREDFLTLKTWVSRSSTSPLSFCLTYRKKGTNVGRLVDFLAMHAFRWKDVTVVFASDLVTPTFVKALSRGTPVLEKLTINSVWSILDRMKEQPLAVLEPLDISSAQRLTEINVGIDLRLEFGLSVLQNVKQIIFEYPGPSFPPNYHLYCLDHCPVTEKLVINTHKFGVNENIGWSDLVRLRIIPTLHTLEVKATRWPTELFLNSLCLPGLRSLTLDLEWVDTFEPPRTWPEIPQLLKRSCADIENLSLRCNAMGESQLIECFQQTPHLKHLAYSERYPKPIDMVARLLTFAEVNHFCQELEHITLTGRPSEMSSSLMAEMISSRWDDQQPDGHGTASPGDRRYLKTVATQEPYINNLRWNPVISRYIEQGFEIVRAYGFACL
ncbi:hypothetical protein BD410DRAFT_279849 [Rickenella mellea]|uniref:F-box domain-containing protein n=1 Tax=Rickenella mellea TaxID=50990 RepID=A0A4Y7Q3C0_9AGAM|nr:hypothetical protein BD410DRAFT_279849 [Rickenella mellea]